MGAAAELNTAGVSVQRGACGVAACAACLAEVLAGLGQMLALPQTMAESARAEAQGAGRHFIPFALAPAVGSGLLGDGSVAHRRDFALRVTQAVEAVLRDALSGDAGAALVDSLGTDAELRELLAITSEPGAAAQDLHADGAWSDDDGARVVTMFVALHDVADEAAGPTYFVPGTHAPRCFPDNCWRAPPAGGGGTREPVWYELRAGDLVLMDSLTWHRGGANASRVRRTLLCASFVGATAPPCVAGSGAGKVPTKERWSIRALLGTRM